MILLNMHLFKCEKKMGTFHFIILQMEKVYDFFKEQTKNDIDNYFVLMFCKHY